MNLNDFKRILISFADSASDIEISKGNLTAFIRGEDISATLITKNGELYIVEDGKEIKAIIWIAIRLAGLEQLADRIREYIQPIDGFINPAGMLLDDVEFDESEIEKPQSDVIGCLQAKLDRNTPGTTNVLYLTSDAGEGKTTIINQLARRQAESYKKKESHWLLVPIPLGGRPFLRFDDIVIASLVNRLRFRLFYYESFIELVKLGLIVPAFDGFEEMFMENSSGEALSATGHLMAKLESQGNVLIAARKAYFDYKSFSSQAKLFDTIGANDVSFSKISINRWDKKQFIEYSNLQKVNDGELIYETVASRLGDIHPLLTRPVLVNRLLKVVNSTNDLAKIDSALVTSAEYFPNFVDAIIVREADTKWIDTSGEPYKPLLTIKQHYELLATIAEEMWINSTDSLDINIIDLLADLYCDSNSFSVRISRQVKERLKQHALLIRSDQNPNHLKFDHEEFQDFFLGMAFFFTIKAKRIPEFRNLLRKGTIFDPTIDAIVVYCKKEIENLSVVFEFLSLVQNNEGPASFVKENCGSIAIKLLSFEDLTNIFLDYYSFPSNSLSGVRLTNLNVHNSYFQITDITGSHIKNCIFENCTFDGIEIEKSTTLENVILRNCEISFVQSKLRDVSYYDPFNINKELISAGFIIENFTIQESNTATFSAPEFDEDLELTQKALRRFIRGSHVNDTVFKLKLGGKAPYFIDEILPQLLEAGILSEIDYAGAGQKRRFKLSTPFDKINSFLKESNGSFHSFLKSVRAHKMKA